jgi:hypothetical protein
MIEGSCLCGAVRFEIDEKSIIVINNCHCSMCRKQSGAAFDTTVHLRPAAFRWKSGEELVKTYESSPGNQRAFCGVCGSVAPSSANWEEHVRVPAGALDDDPGRMPELNIFSASKAPWYTITDALPCFPDAGTEAQWREVMSRRAVNENMSEEGRER